jgi:hypothetical protein
MGNKEMDLNVGAKLGWRVLIDDCLKMIVIINKEMFKNRYERENGFNDKLIGR